MKNPKIAIEQDISELKMNKEEELDIYLESGGFIKIAISDKGTPVILVDGVDWVIVDKWHGHIPYKEKMAELWDKEHEHDEEL